MNSIIGFSELALDNENPAPTQNYLTNIMENSRWLLQIINDILDISKIESGKMELENIPFDMSEMFMSCRTLIMPKAIEKGLALHFYAEPSVGKILYGDPTRLRQVLVNLLSNAVKFTNQGIIKMLASVKEIGQNSVTMYFEVKDSGIGITGEQTARIFDPFIQAETGTTRKYGGTGLGLAITRNIIELMGSKLSVDSTEGVGSKFSFEIAFDAVDTGNGNNINFDKIIFDDMERPTFDGEVLLCEDNSMNQQVISEHLSRVGLKTTVAENGRIGVDTVVNREKANLKQFDLIFMDIHMPVMDGIEAAAEIFKLNPNIPIVAMTANIMANDKTIYEAAGMNDVVGKPFTSQELWRCLMKYFKPRLWEKEDTAKLAQSDKELQQKLINNFVKSNNNIYNQITVAIQTGDLKLAHRLAHTLKSNAGQLKKNRLQQAADEVEHHLTNGINRTIPQHLDVLKKELDAVLTELTPLVQSPNAKPKDPPRPEKIAELLNELEPLLIKFDTDCLQMLDELRAIPNSNELVSHIENIDFNKAIPALNELMKGYK